MHGRAMCTGSPSYLYERTGGHIGSLMTLITRGCYRAIAREQERISRDLLDSIRIDEAAEKARTRPRLLGAAKTRRGESMTVRTLPMRLEIAEGEAADSWIEALARRYRILARRACSSSWAWTAWLQLRQYPPSNHRARRGGNRA